MTAQAGPLTDRADELIGRYPLTATLMLRVDRRLLRVRSNQPEMIEALAAYYYGFLAPDETAAVPDIDVVVIEAPTPDLGLDFVTKPPDPGKTRVKDATAEFPDGRALRKIRTGMQFLFGRTRNLAIGPALRNTNQVVNFINNRFVQHELLCGALLCHAAGVAQAGQGLAIAGMSNRGKSTLSLHLLNRGLTFVTNDRLLLEAPENGVVRMLGLAKYPRVNPGTLLHNVTLVDMLPADERSELEALPRESLWRLERKYDVDVERYYGRGRFRLAARFRGLVILTWELDAGAPELRPVDLRERRDLLQGAFMKLPGVHFYTPPELPEPDFSAEAYLERLAGADVYELRGGVDFEQAAGACCELLQCYAADA